MELAKKDALYQDAMETAAQSGDQDLVEGLLRFFVQEKEAECFSACLYTCGEFVKPDVALELAWVNQLMGWVMPYMIQCVREYTSKVRLSCAPFCALSVLLCDFFVFVLSREHVTARCISAVAVWSCC